MTKSFKPKLLWQAAVASLVATLATAGIVGAATTIGSNISTAGTLDVTGAVTTGAATTIGTDLTVTSGARIGAGSTGTHLTALADDSLLAEGQAEFDGIVWFDDSLRASSTLMVTGASTLTGDTSVGGTLNVTGAATLASTLGVTGAATLSNTLNVTGAATLASTLGVSGLTTVGGGLISSATTTLSGRIQGANPLIFDGATANDSSTLTFSVADPTGTNTITFPDSSGTIALTSSPTFTGAVVLPTVTLGGVASSTQAGVGLKLNGLTVYGDTTISGSLTANNLNFAGGAVTGVTNLTASGNLAFATASSTGTVKFGSINSDTGSVDFGNENLTTSGTVDGIDVSTIPSTYAPLASPTFTGTASLPIVSITGNTALTTASSTGLIKAHSLLINSDASSAITRHISATASSVDFASLNTSTCGVQRVTVAGAASGDTVTANPTTATEFEAGLIWSAFVYTADTVEIRLCNISGTNPLDPAARNWKIDVWKH